MKILVADDDAISSLILQKMLKKAGYEVVVTDNGYTAVENLLRCDGPRLALLDWMMPGLDGLGVCREVRKRRDGAYIYITVLTSKEAKEDLVAGLEAGADDYLTKPCNAEELKARLRTGERILRLEDTLVEAREEMRFKATHDPLTSLWNREAILAYLANGIQSLHGDQTTISLLLCDVDYFKRINDCYGHLIGDNVLKEMAGRLRDAVGPNAAVGRYGGEEFLIVLNECDEDSLRIRAERVRKAVNGSLFVTDSGLLTLSISLGGLTVNASNQSQRADALLSQADAALYRAKMEGRNRLVVAEKRQRTDQAQSANENCGFSDQGWGASFCH